MSDENFSKRATIGYTLIALFLALFVLFGYVSQQADAQAPPEQCAECPYGNILEDVYNEGTHSWVNCPTGEDCSYTIEYVYGDLRKPFGYKICSNTDNLTTHASANGTIANVNYDLGFVNPGECFFVYSARNDYFNDFTQVKICAWNPELTDIYDTNN